MKKKPPLVRGTEFSDDHRVHLLQGAEELFPALTEAMDAALSDIQFETYIFDFTGSGAAVAEALMRAAQRGVRTQLVVDGVGTGALPEAWAARLQAAGVQYSVYSPLGPLGLLLPHRWRRLHRKLCVVDGRLLFCGGINVLDDFHDPNYGTLDAPRFDFAVRVTGPLGSAYLRRKHTGPMLCVAGGTGLAPILSIVRGVVAAGMQNPIHLYLGVRAERDVYGQGWLAELQSKHPALQVHTVVASGRAPGCRSGLVTDAIEHDWPSLSGFRAYLCGAPPMVEATSRLVSRLGVLPEQIYADAFYASGT